MGRQSNHNLDQNFYSGFRVADSLPKTFRSEISIEQCRKPAWSHLFKIAHRRLHHRSSTGPGESVRLIGWRRRLLLPGAPGPGFWYLGLRVSPPRFPLAIFDFPISLFSPIRRAPGFGVEPGTLRIPSALPACWSLLTAGLLLISGFSSFLNRRHHDTPTPPRSRPAADHEIHVPVQRGQKIHQPFDGKALQLEAIS